MARLDRKDGIALLDRVLPPHVGRVALILEAANGKELCAGDIRMQDKSKHAKARPLDSPQFESFGRFHSIRT